VAVRTLGGRYLLGTTWTHGTLPLLQFCTILLYAFWRYVLTVRLLVSPPRRLLQARTRRCCPHHPPHHPHQTVPGLGWADDSTTPTPTAATRLGPPPFVERPDGRRVWTTTPYPTDADTGPRPMPMSDIYTHRTTTKQWGPSRLDGFHHAPPRPGFCQFLDRLPPPAYRWIWLNGRMPHTPV